MLNTNLLLHPGCEWVGFIPPFFLWPPRHELTLTFNWSVCSHTFSLTNILDS